jgi:hypothetical protein
MYGIDKITFIHTEQIQTITGRKYKCIHNHMSLVIDTDQGQTDMNIHMKKKCLFRYLATSLFPMKIDIRNNKNAFFSNQHLAIIDRVQH